MGDIWTPCHLKSVRKKKKELKLMIEHDKKSLESE